MAIGQRFYLAQPFDVDALFTAEPAVLYEVSAVNMSGLLRWLQLHDAAGPLGDGAIPLYTYPVQHEQIISIAPPGPPGDQGRRFPLGVLAVWSSTQAPLTNILGNTGPIFMAGRLTT